MIYAAAVVVMGVMRDTQRALNDTLGLAHALARGDLTQRISAAGQDEQLLVQAANDDPAEQGSAGHHPGQPALAVRGRRARRGLLKGLGFRLARD